MPHLTHTLHVDSGPWHYDVVTDSCSRTRSRTKMQMSNKIINLNWSTVSIFNPPQHAPCGAHTLGTELTVLTSES